MKASKLKDLRGKDLDELQQLLVAKRQEVMDTRFTHATGSLENSAIMRQQRRDVARLLTIISDKSRSEANA